MSDTFIRGFNLAIARSKKKNQQRHHVTSIKPRQAKATEQVTADFNESAYRTMIISKMINLIISRKEIIK
ncbi:hypothetical protein [Pseudomonas auratipiscis]|uniref:Uncharacterized protein n=1 Tax=Pseudomonas auratipiscis TaxID=3115853 RepID=A0AB35WZC7_9PSED|nr:MULTISPECIES: hypothetical protein [unclassified Pseudomonas]MEE1869827.1 hypothetical protein [Pseudomonas sp. 120P]MEE1960835.1 hypothetical protein [Pseudomonas sp. 119P]